MELSILYPKIGYYLIPLLEIVRFRHKVVKSFLKSLILIVSKTMRNLPSSHNGKNNLLEHAEHISSIFEKTICGAQKFRFALCCFGQVDFYS